MKVQAQHLQAGDIVGSGETVTKIIINSIAWPSTKVYVELVSAKRARSILWGKYTMINIKDRKNV